MDSVKIAESIFVVWRFVFSCFIEENQLFINTSETITVMSSLAFLEL